MDVEIRDAEPGELVGVRGLIEEYVQSLGVDLGFQEIETELGDLAAAYRRPGERSSSASPTGSSRAASPFARWSRARAR